MTGAMEAQIFCLFLLFCRVGGCLLFAPGLSSPRIPTNIRLFAALGVTAAVSPLLVPELLAKLTQIPGDQHALLILRETLTGSLIGLMARCFFLALQFAATAIANFIGLSGIPGIPLEDEDTGSPLATLVSTAATALIFTLGLHIEIVKAVIDSYAVMPLAAPVLFEALLANFLHTVTETWLLALRLSGPFLLYGVIVNFALGVGNRFAPQVSVYHATTGAVMLGGFLLLYLIWIDWSLVFVDSYRAWLVEGGF